MRDIQYIFHSEHYHAKLDVIGSYKELLKFSDPDKIYFYMYTGFSIEQHIATNINKIIKYSTYYGNDYLYEIIDESVINKLIERLIKAEYTDCVALALELKYILYGFDGDVICDL